MSTLVSRKHTKPIGQLVGSRPGDLECLAGHEAMTLAEISRRLGLSEGETMSLLAMLAGEGKVRIRQVALGG